MRFTDFLRTAVLLFGASATVLAVVTIAGATSKGDTTLIFFSLGWWLAGHGGRDLLRAPRARDRRHLDACSPTRAALPCCRRWSPGAS